MSRVEDYFETDKSIDAKRVAIHGVSRLGKTVMWAGAHDQRFAAVIASCSGEGGAALSHRDYGETIAHLTAPTRYPYQFAANYAKWAGFPDKAPMDAQYAGGADRSAAAAAADRQHGLLVRSRRANFSRQSPRGRSTSCLARMELDTDVWPAAKQPILHDLSYYMHDGGHGMVPVRLGHLRRVPQDASASGAVTVDNESKTMPGAGQWCCRWLRWDCSRAARLGLRAEFRRYLRSGLSESSGLGEAAHLVALDERQRHRRRHHKRSRVDEAIRHRGISTGGCGCGQRAGGGARRSTSARRSGITLCATPPRRRSGLVWRCPSSVLPDGARPAGRGSRRSRR